MGQAYVDRVWDVIEKAGICMMTTRFDGGMRARPMEARPDKEEGVIWFLTDHRGLKDDEIDATHRCASRSFTRRRRCTSR